MFLRNIITATAQLIGLQVQRVKDTVQLMLTAGRANQELITQAGNNFSAQPLDSQPVHNHQSQSKDPAHKTTQAQKPGKKQRRALAEPTDNHSKEAGSKSQAPAPQTRRRVGRPRKAKA